MAAKMKHARHKEKGGQAGRSGPFPRTALPKGRKEERAFREQLAREYGVERAPKAFQQRFEQTLLQLPDQVPARPRPVYYLLRRTAAAAAVLVLTFSALLGVNTTYPQLTEALPGLGPVFRAINQDGADPSPLPLPTPSPEPKKEFQPVTLTSAGDFPCSLLVEDAWCDGKTLQLSLSVEKSPELLSPLGFSEPETEFLWQEGYALQGGFFSAGMETDSAKPYVTEDYFIQAPAGKEGQTNSGELSQFVDDGQGRLRARWRMVLDESAQAAGSGELTVYFSLNTLSLVRQQEGIDPDPVFSWPAGFEADLTVPVDRSKNRVFTSQVPDNGASLLCVDYAPSQVEVEMELPDMGYLGDMLLEFPDNDSKEPLGSFAQLQGHFLAADGSGTAGFPFELTSKEELEGAGGTRRRMRFTFSNHYLEEDCRGPLVLTITEAPMWPSRVVAEFTIELDTGSVAPSENYREQGLERADTTRDPRYPRTTGCFTNGFLAAGVNHNQEERMGATATLVAETLEPGRVLVLNGYSQGILAQSLMVVCEEWGECLDESGACFQSMVAQPSTEFGYPVLAFTLYPPDDWGWYESYGSYWAGYDRLELVDGNTGEVLIEDLRQAYEQAVETIVGRVEEPDLGEEPPPAQAAAAIG